MNKTLILDGAMGTELVNRGLELPLPIWSADANLTHPNIVKDIHSGYIQAGANIITTNTFRSTTWTYCKAGYSNIRARERAKESLLNAVDCARSSALDSIQIAGSITSIDDCYSPNKYPGKNVAEDSFNESMEWLTNAGLNLILFETMGNSQEIEDALTVAQNYEVDVWVSLIMKNGNQLLDGTSLLDLFLMMNNYNIDCLLNNCNQLETTLDCLDQFKNNEGIGKWGVYPNLGITDYGNDYFDTVTESNFRAGINLIIKMNPDVIGICCGSTPEHIRLLNSHLNKKEENEIKNKIL